MIKFLSALAFTMTLLFAPLAIAGEVTEVVPVVAEGGLFAIIPFVLLIVHYAASIYVGLTSTPDDDAFYGKYIYPVIEKFGGVLTTNSKLFAGE